MWSRSNMMSLKTGWILLSIASISFGFETCYDYDNFQRKTLFCSDSCCGTGSYQYCCNTAASSTTALIIGISVGVGVLIALIVGIVVCCVCCCKSSQGHRGQVVSSGQQLTVISAGPNTVTGAYNAGYVHTVQSPPGAFIQPPAAMAQPPPPYSPPIGPVHPPGQGQAHPPMQSPALPPGPGPAHPPMQSPAYPPGPGQAHPPMQSPAHQPGPAHLPKQGQAAHQPPLTGPGPPPMGNVSQRTKTEDTDEHVYTSLQW